MKIKLFYILYLALLPFVIYGQTEEKLEIVPSDSTYMRQTTTAQGSLIELYGNPHLRQGKTEMFCKRVKWWRESGEVIIEDDVRIFDEVKELIADYVFYYVDTKIYKAKGNVVLKDSIRQISADEITFFKLEDRVIADGNVVMDDHENNIQIFSGHAELENQTDYALITQQPVFVRKDTTQEEELKIYGEKMELFDKGDKAVVTDSVRIVHKDVSARCGIAEFYKEKNEVILKEEPFVTQKLDKLSGGLIHLFINDQNELEKAIVEDHATVISRVDTTGVDTRENKLTGQKITMDFVKNDLSKVLVENKATSYYYVIEKEEDKGVNNIIGDKITVFLENRKIVNIRIESNPQLSEGIFYPTGFEPANEGK